MWDIVWEVVYEEGTTTTPLNPFHLYFTPPYNLPYTLLRRLPINFLPRLLPPSSIIPHYLYLISSLFINYIVN